MEGAELKWAHDWFGLGFSTKDPEMVHGLHGPNDLLVIDDAHGVDIKLFDEVENMMAGGNTHILLLYNPVSLTGLTYECAHDQSHLWTNIKIAAEDTPNFRHNQLVYPQMLHPQQAEEWRRRWGPESNFCKVKLNADFPSQESDTLISLDWIEKAMIREVPEGGKKVLGVDVARFGPDDSVMCFLHGRKVLPLESRHGNDTMATTGWVRNKRRLVGADAIGVDSIGIGAGVVDRLMELKEPVTGVNVAESPVGNKDEDERYLNIRSQVWFMVREALNPDNPQAISLPKDMELQAELSSVKYGHDSAGRIKVESKEDMKKRLGKSPDKADALGLAIIMASGLLTKGGKWRPVI